MSALPDRKNQSGHIHQRVILPFFFFSWLSLSSCSSVLFLPTRRTMDFSQPFSVLNDRLKPRVSTSPQLYSSLSRLEWRQNRTFYGPTMAAAPAEPQVVLTRPEEPEEEEEEDATSLEEGNVLAAEPDLKDEVDEGLAEEDSGSSQSEGKDVPGALTSDGTRDSSETGSQNGDAGTSLYIDGTLPDLLSSGRPLGRRRTLGHVSATLNEVRREVELSRKRSMKLKAQVDRLQENRAGKGWSQHRERVTEEVLSILHLLQPITDPNSSPPKPGQDQDCLDSALVQLQSVARQLAISHTKQESKCGRGNEEDGAILQQALRDRDDAVEKKKAMEAELLRSKTELMQLNNQLLEAVQKRLELSLELEAWKDDVQRILQQNVLSQQQQAEQQQQQQQQQKTSRLGILRRTKVVQRPTNFPMAAPPPAPPTTTNTNQIFFNKTRAKTEPPVSSSSSSSTTTTTTWRDKLRRGGRARLSDTVVQMEAQAADGFQVVSLD